MRLWRWVWTHQRRPGIITSVINIATIVINIVTIVINIVTIVSWKCWPPKKPRWSHYVITVSVYESNQTKSLLQCKNPPYNQCDKEAIGDWKKNEAEFSNDDCAGEGSQDDQEGHLGELRCWWSKWMKVRSAGIPFCHTLYEYFAFDDDDKEGRVLRITAAREATR